MPRRKLDEQPAAPTPPAEPKARGAGVRLRGVADGVAWTVYDHVDGGGELAWRDATNKRRKARVPPSVSTDAQLKTFATVTIRTVVQEAKRADEAKPAQPTRPTFKSFSMRWTSGELARLYPDHVKFKRTSADDAQRLATHVYDHCGDVALEDFTLADAERVMQKLPATLAPATRRQVAQLLHRVLRLAVYPARIIAANPLPSGFLPKAGKGKAHGYLYPSEDSKLLAHKPTDLGLRMLLGFLAREGMRASEACGLTWDSIDLEHGAVTLDENKTDDARSWPMDPGVRAALAIWKNIAPKPKAKPGETIDPETLHVFVDEDAKPYDPARSNLAERLRAELKAAGVERAQLFETTATRQQLRAHDLRATFVTLALASGKSESWVADRTGHKSSAMISRYKRAARTVAELGLGTLRPLVDAIPELAALKPKAEKREARASRRRRRADAPRRRAVVSRLVSRDRSARQQKPKTPGISEGFMVGQERLELSANGLRVRCSTN